jgi:hypothetical protein
MWILNLYFFVVIFAAIRTGDLWMIIPITIIFMLLHYWLAETEDNGTDNYTQRPGSYDNNYYNRLADDTHSDLDNSKT